MTPPIFTPDGTEVEEVILPDGSKASEVIAPDGTVVFDAIPDSVVDNFELEGSDPAGPYSDGDDITEFYAGDTSEFSITTDESSVGSRSLEFNDSNFRTILSKPEDGLPRYPEYGETVNYYVRFGQNVNDLRFIFGAEDADNFFGVQTNPDRDRVRFFKRVGGSFESVATDETVNYPLDEWLKVEVDWQDEKTISVMDSEETVLGSVSGADTTFDNEMGIGFEGLDSGTNPGYFDGVHVPDE